MEIVPGLYRVPGLRRANAYLVLEKGLALVDAGMPGDEEAVLKTIKTLDHKPAELAQIIVTHHHHDHCGGLAALKSQTGARILAHAADAPYICGELARPLPKHWLLGPLFRLLRMRSHGQGVPVDGTLQDGDHLALLGGATVIHLPGHSPGSIALHFPAEKVLISGDAVIVQNGRPTPPPRFFSQDPEEAAAVIRRLTALDFEILCPGHGEPITSEAAEHLRTTLDKQMGRT
jgi:glyoxylase-like metal-dependent hydrolase (beta-lactamase superfamily II)